MTSTQSNPAEPDHIRLGRALKALFIEYNLRDVWVNVDTHTAGERLIYSYLREGMRVNAQGQHAEVKHWLTVEQRIESNETIE